MQLEQHPDEEIDRSDSWVLGRKDKKGNYKSEKVKEKAKEIVSFHFIFHLRIVNVVI